jgi:hypothetical protein
MNDTAETTRTIEQVLVIRLQAAQLRMLERTTALVKEQEALVQGRTGWDDAGHDKLISARRLADEDLQLVQREIDVQRDPALEPVPYDPASTFALRRYAAVLMAEDLGLGAETALAWARLDEHIRFEDYYARTHDDSDLDEDALDEDADN